MNWKNLLASVSESVNDELRLRHDYLVAENRILRNQIDCRVQLTDSECKELAEIGAKLGKSALAEIATVAQPDTILAWHRKFANQNVPPPKPPRSVGRPRVDQEIEDWVVRMARENRSWGYDRIQGSLKHLGYTISDQTVGNILKRHGIPPAPERKKTVTWCEFIRSHWDVLIATGFFNSEVWSWFGQIIPFVLSFIHFSHYQVQVVRMTLHQQMRVLKALVRSALGLKLQMWRWGALVTQRSCARRIRAMLLEPTRSELEFAHARQTQCQVIAEVVNLSSARQRRIRDGPICHGRQLHSQLTDGDRKAA
jgi:transposase